MQQTAINITKEPNWIPILCAVITGVLGLLATWIATKGK